MILTCPECTIRFKIADHAIGPNGRTVRCSQCSVTWFVAAEPDGLSLDEAEKTTEIREEIINEPVSNINLKNHSPESQNSVFGNLESGSDDVFSDVGAHAAIRETADRKKARRRLLGVSMIWVVTLTILALFALAAFLFRAKIVEKFPGTAPVYRAIGLEANVSGLEISFTDTKFGNNEGVQVLFVSGRIKNFDIKTRDVELIQLSFINDSGEILTSWVVEPTHTELKSGQVIKFTSQYPNPPVDAVTLVSSFVSETDMSDTIPVASK